MSEYQCYEFVALDRPLTSKEMTELRAISTRAEISPSRFWNEYDWGDLKADPAKLLARYFDAHLYFANWGARRFMLRLPAKGMDISALRPYFTGDRTKLTKAGAFVVLDLWSQDDEPGDEDDQPILVPGTGVEPARKARISFSYRLLNRRPASSRPAPREARLVPGQSKTLSYRP